MRHTQPTRQQVKLWKKWVADRPACIREAVEKYKLDPWTLYRLKGTGPRVYVLSLSEPEPTVNQLVQKVTVRVGVSGLYNLVTHERDVFGIDPADLEECDLPKPDEQVGSLDLPIDLVKNLHEQYKDSQVPPHMMLDLISRYPLKKGK